MAAGRLNGGRQKNMVVLNVMPVTTRSTSAALPPLPRRSVTSAVEGLTVAEVRKCLDVVRRSWSNRSRQEPFSLLTKVNRPFTIQEFCFRFVLGHHRKRHAKSKTKSRNA